ncbi:MAG: hypothetical protein ABI692_18025 [Terracoccus sp.]
MSATFSCCGAGDGEAGGAGSAVLGPAASGQDAVRPAWDAG